MHTIQKHLLKRLVDKNHLKYSELSQDYSAEDNIVFHIKQLVKFGFMAKIDNEYILTQSGLFASGQFDLDSLEEQESKTAYLAFVCLWQGKYLLRERTQDTQHLYK